MSSPIGSTWSTRHLGMFRGASQLGNFSRLASILPARVVRRSESPAPIRRTARAVRLPSAYEFGGRARETHAFLTDVETVGLIVLKDGVVVHDWYATPKQASLQWPSWSIAKSIVSCLMGIAIDEGAVRSIHDPVTRYAPTLAGSAYDGVSIEHVLQMCSGARWSEIYADPDSDVQRNALVLAGIGSRDGLAAATRNAFAPGTRHQYNSNDTHVIGMVLRGATGRGLTRLLQDNLWDPLGMEDDAFFLVDSRGVEWAAAGLQATLRDFAKFGLLYLNDGVAHGKRVVSSDWVRLSTSPRAPHLAAGPKTLSPGSFGYGYQWWLAPANDGAFSAIGVYNQYLYVNPQRGVVIAKSSANRRYAASYDEAGYRDEEHMALFGAIANSL